jgi:hypothetical protein
MKGANVNDDGQHPARRPEEPATGTGAQTVMTSDEMTAALEAGYATMFGQSFSWIAHYRGAWWVRGEQQWMRCDDSEVSTELDRRHTFLASMDAQATIRDGLSGHDPDPSIEQLALEALRRITDQLIPGRDRRRSRRDGPREQDGQGRCFLPDLGETGFRPLRGPTPRTTRCPTTAWGVCWRAGELSPQVNPPVSHLHSGANRFARRRREIAMSA